MNKLKTKILAGLLFLFVVVFIMAGTGSAFVYQLANDTRAIMKDSQTSVEYALILLKEIDEINALQLKMRFAEQGKGGKVEELDEQYALAIDEFEQTLNALEAAATLAEEKQLASELSKDFKTLLRTFESSQRTANTEKFTESEAMHELCRVKILTIYDTNKLAILERNSQAKLTADRVLLYMGLMGVLCLTLTLVFIGYFPNRIADPISDLKVSVEAIMRKKYNQPIKIESKDEIGDLARCFNALANKLRIYDESNLAKLVAQKLRNEALLENIKEGVVVIDELQNVQMANQAASNILSTETTALVGQNRSDLVLKHESLQKLFFFVDKNPLNGSVLSLRMATGSYKNFKVKHVPLTHTWAERSAEHNIQHLGALILIQEA